MISEVDPIGDHECVELAATAGYYLSRNVEALTLLTKTEASLPVYSDSGISPLHYETMVIHSVEVVTGPSVKEGEVRLHPALPINGASVAHEMQPVKVRLLDSVEVRAGFIALLQRMNETNEIGMVYFFSDDHPVAA